MVSLKKSFDCFGGQLGKCSLVPQFLLLLPLGFGLYFDRPVGLYFDGVGVLVLVSMQNQVVWRLIAEFLCRLL